MKLKQTLLLVAILTCNLLTAQKTAQNSYWTKDNTSLSKQVLDKKNIKENSYAVYQLDEQRFKNSLNAGSKTSIVYFPNQEGAFIKFQVQEKSNMAPALAAKYASIKSYRGFAVSDKSQIISFTISNNGLSALMMSHSNERALSVIKLSGNQYISFNSVESKNKIEEFNCSSELSQLKKSTKSLTTKNSNAKTAQNNASGLRTLRLAVVAPGEYTELVGGTVEAALTAINTTVNAANSVFEEDLGIVLQLIANNDQLIFIDKTNDPYNIEGYGVSTNSSYLNTTTQEVIDARIPFNDYDLGHLFIARDEDGDSAYGMGNAYGIGNVGTSEKGSAWNYWSQPDVASNPGFVKLFLHEAGHNLGANHTFSFVDEKTFVQAEPSSGRTIMSYGPDHFYYHFSSINQILNHFDANPWNVYLGTVISYTNQISLTDLTTTFYIPKGTAFYLEAPEIGSDPSYQYNWEGLDYGITGDMSFWGPQMVSGPLFSSTIPSNNRIRYFPSLQTILDGELTNDFDSYIGYNQDAQKIGFYETLPSIPRTLSFGLTVRDPNFTKGVYLDSTSVVVVKSTQPFKITSNLAAQNMPAGETTTLTWEVGNTNIAPINAEFVDILLSTDGGLTFPITLAKNVPNDGSETVGFPNINTTDARIKIQPVNKIFFTINEGSFSITPSEIVLFFENLNLELNNCDLTPQSFSTAFQYQTANGFSETSALSIAGLPAGLTASLSQNSVSASDTDIDIDFQADATLAAGTYAIDIIATAASKTVTKQIQVIILSNTAITVLSTPADTSQNVSLNPILTWVANTNATKYRVQVSKDVSFATTLIDTYTFNTNYTPINLDANTTYYWRVSGVNTCSGSTFSSAFSFTTVLAYEQEFSLISHLKPIKIPSAESGYVITIEDDVTLLDLNVLTSFKGVNINYLGLSLTSPDGVIIPLISKFASDNNTKQINAEADDHAEEAQLTSSDVLNLSYIPEQSLSVLNGKSIKGDWLLTVNNYRNSDSNKLLVDFTLKIKTIANYYVPIAKSASVKILGTESKTIDLQATNQQGQLLSGFSVKIARLPEHGTLLNIADNAILSLNEVVNATSVIYQGSAGYTGTDYFYFSANDQLHDSRPAIISLFNLGDYQAPKALPVYVATLVNTPMELNLSVSNLILENPTFTLTLPTNGTASYVNGNVLYTPNQGFIGKDTFSYTVNDGRSESTNAISVKVFSDYKTDIKPAFMMQGSLSGYGVNESIAVSGDGSIVAGSSAIVDYDWKDFYPGRVIVYKRNSQTGVYSQLGNEIFGDKPGDQFGGYITLSDDGKRLAVATNLTMGFDFDDLNKIDYIKIYEYNETANTWDQIGQTFYFEGRGVYVELKLDLNTDGSVLAISNSRYSKQGEDLPSIGSVEVYKYAEATSQWVLLGNKLIGSEHKAMLGYSMSLNGAGDTMVISNPHNSLAFNTPGFVRVYKFNGATWEQKGSTLIGKEVKDIFGSAVSINNAGNVIAVGASYGFLMIHEGVGYVSIYTFNETNDEWELKGQTLEGALESDFKKLDFGHSVSLDGTGNLLTVGAPAISDITVQQGFAVVYKYNSQTKRWSKLDLTNNNGKLQSTKIEMSGSIVALSKDGTVVLNTSRSRDANRSEVLIYKLIIDNEAEVEDLNWAPEPIYEVYKEAQQESPLVISLRTSSNNFQYLISKLPSNGSLKHLDASEIKLGEFIPNFQGSVYYTSNANATSDSFEYKVYDGNKFSKGIFLITPISKRILPLITLLGNNPEIIYAGTTYTDAGATAIDSNGGDLTSSIVLTGSVNTSTVGVYTLIYNVSDAASNAAPSKRRTVNVVNVVDTTVPLITLLGNNPEIIYAGTTYSDAGATATDSNDGDLTSSIVLTGSVDTSTVGVYTLSYNVSDAASNAAATVTRTVNVVNLLDTTVPVITLLGNNPETIEAGMIYTDEGATATDSNDGDLTSSIVLTGSVDTSTVGVYTLSYNVSDAASNAAATVTRTVNVVDTTVPKITMLGNNPETIEVGTTYTDAGATATDSNDGDLTSSIVLTGSVDTSTVGVYTLIYNVSDAASNAAPSKRRTVNVINTLGTDVFENSRISIYPNPTKGILYLQGDVSKLKSIEVYSILGKRLLEVKENFNEINISNLQSGMYLLRVNTDEASVTYKIVKE